MLKSALAAVTLAMTLATAPASAQPAAPPTAHEQAALVGMPLYSADGEKLGEITQVGMHGEHQAVEAELAGFLGIGPKTVIIPLVALEQKTDRVALGLTAAEVRDLMSQK